MPPVTMKKDRHQREAHALRKLSKAIDRMITASTNSEKARAAQWAKAWATIAGINTKRG